MTHYQELLIEQNAGIDEIHKSYKRLTRLLHPDLHRDPELRELAEVQMRRLNEMLQVLKDPEARRQYDLSIELPPRAPSAMSVETSRFSLPWLVIGVAAGSLIVFFENHQHILSPYSVNMDRKPAAILSDNTGQKQDRPRPGSLLAAPPPVHPEALRPAPAAATGAAGSRAEGEKPDPAPAPAERVSGTAPNETAALGVEECGAGCWSGAWLYVRRKGAPEPGLYPPEYIEMRVTEQGGTLRGFYRARYRITDRPIASEVSFDFEGRVGAGEAVLPWSASRGERGELKLRRLTANTAEVSWYVTDFHGGNGLGAGTAVLVRREEE